MKKRVVVIIILLLIVLAGGSYFYYNHSLEAVGKNEDVVLIVSEGETANHLVSDMNKKGLLKNELMTKIYVRLNKPSLKQNTYLLNKSMTVDEMFTIMEEAKSEYVINNKLKIIEGDTIPTIAKKVGKVLGTSKKEVLKKWSNKKYIKSLCKTYWFMDEKTLTNKKLKYSLEGYLYPETYYINETNPTIDSITTKLLEEMDNHLSPYKDSINKMDMTTHEFITLTSIVEKESLYDEDVSKIAGVFMNRLKKNMYLQSDVTVNYALNRKGVKVTSKMLKKKSPYNTYLHKGLPVGPVSSIQEKTIKNVIHYKKHKYYYFFAKKDGSVVYSKTYKAHLKAVEKYKWY